MKRSEHHFRAVTCGACPAPCIPVTDLAAHVANPAATCPRGAWPMVMPGLAVMAGNVAGALLKEAAGLVQGLPRPSMEDAAARHEVCKANACGRYSAAEDRCAECGCHLPLKVTLRAGRCPLGHW